MGLTRAEMETIINFNEADDKAEIYTYNGRLIRRLTEYAAQRPEECVLCQPDASGAHKFIFPKKWVKVNAPRILTDEEREKLSERAKKMLANRNAE